VECFVDIVGPDGTMLQEVERATQLLRATLHAGRRTRARVADGAIIAEFSVVLAEAQPLQRFDELVDAALALCEDRRSLTSPTGPPLEIEVTRDEAGLRFRLSASAAERVAAARLGGGPSTGAVTMGYDVKDAFEQMHGPVYPHAAEWLTGVRSLA
jgi:hypothetical protein